MALSIRRERPSRSARPDVDGQREAPAAGLHFVVFTPTSDDFHRTRLAMDGILPDGTSIPLHPRSRGQGFNSILQTTHRQNFLVPPRCVVCRIELKPCPRERG